MLLDGKGQIWDLAEFEDEAELEEAVFKNHRLLYGDQSLLFLKALISTEVGSKTWPDAFVVDLENNEWYVVEVELLHHGVYRHIVSQVTKQVTACDNPQTKMVLRHKFLSQIAANKSYLQLFKDLEIPDIKVADTIESIIAKKPKISIPIDKSDLDLKSWAQSLKYEVEIHEVLRYRNRTTNAEMLQFPDIESMSTVSERTDPERDEVYSLSGKDLLVRLVEADLLKVGQELSMQYKGKKFTAKITPSGQLELEDGSKHSPSLAAIKCVSSITPSRTTDNGLRSWQTVDGLTLRELRLKLFGREEKDAA